MSTRPVTPYCSPLGGSPCVGNAQPNGGHRLATALSGEFEQAPLLVVMLNAEAVNWLC